MTIYYLCNRNKNFLKNNFCIGRQSKSKSTCNDLSSSSSSSSSSLSLSIVPLRKTPRSNRLAPPSQVLSSLSDDSLSEKFQSKQSPPCSTVISKNDSSPPTSVYLVQLKNKTNSSGLTKTITTVWKNKNSRIEDEEIGFYSRYSIERVQPIITTKKRSIPISSRNIILQRGQTDYWQNCETLPDTILTSSCENSTGSATHLLSPSIDFRQTKTSTHSNGHIISITTTKRRQQSLLNQSKNIQWNIEGDGKQFRYSKIKWDSDEQLHKHNKYQTKHIADSNTDTGLSSEQNNQSVSVVLHHTDVPNEIPEGIIFNLKPYSNKNTENLYFLIIKLNSSCFFFFSKSF
jgi:hypothetical protein